MYYKPRAVVEFRVRDWEDKETIKWEPRVIELQWTKNNYRHADELKVTVDWTDGGADPRLLKQLRCGMWFWDAMEHGENPENRDRFLRFEGICKTGERKVGADSWQAEFVFHDYTALFIEMKPFPSDGIPDWTDTIATAWGKIRAHTGWRDRSTNTIKSTVDAISEIVFEPPELAGWTLGQVLPARFHTLSKPTPPARESAWGVWLYLMDMLALVPRIDGTTLIVSTTNEHYKEDTAPRLIWGHNILSLEEKVDNQVSRKGILGKAFDTLSGQQLESAWPLPSDGFVKKTQAVVKRAQKEGREVALQDVGTEYIPYFFPGVMDQDALDRLTRACFEHFSKQEVKGKLTTPEMTLSTVDGQFVDLLGLNAGDCIQVGVDSDATEIVLNTENLDERVHLLMDKCGYVPAVARLIATSIASNAFRSLIYHVETLDVQYANGRFEVTIGYHNKVYGQAG